MTAEQASIQVDIPLHGPDGALLCFLEEVLELLRENNSHIKAEGN